ncbi:hypothetical protein CONCODRAFT_6056 [Conidiobolus coronatus NRRL 28638]|uniref:Uncharacterized protein n=1 Tax=Conidiobolus coronatus (strain ATCC 28846 / CBS 209.66 / NRRL 28638) TaxID=796925 RepID=A0A137P8I3_CONC2|nr:hypothetical protein CONCODRAFT_6056 [Conidiobolus coronatus NRRL 28638]|eukprot:KXN71241.1 hypothetical protein CONCODRAFT_6056 [Conidiobolus coronatus NRRL 28638]
MKYLTVISSTLLLVLHPVISDPLFWNKGFNQPSNSFNQGFNNGQQPAPAHVPTANKNVVNTQKPDPVQQTPQNTNSQGKSNNQQPNIINNNANNANTTSYQQLAQFMKQFGVDLGTANAPKLQEITPTSSSDKVSDRSNIIENIGTNIVQGYVNQNAQLINKMLTSPDQPFNVQSLFNNPVSGALGLLGPLSGVNTNITQNRNGPSVQQQVAQQGDSITLYSLVDIGVVWLYNNQDLYSAVLSLAIQFLQLFPFLLDAVFRIIASVNNLFNPSLLNLILKFLYNYQAHSPANWVKLTQLLSVFLTKNITISAQALRNIIALVGNLPI